MSNRRHLLDTLSPTISDSEAARATKNWQDKMAAGEDVQDDQKLLAALRGRLPLDEAHLVETGPAIGAHAGRGTLVASQSVIPTMLAQKRGSIVCISSVSAQRGGGILGGPHYSAAKAGVLGLARAMAREFGIDGVRINCITPGLIETDITQGKLTPEKKAEIAETIPLARLGRAEDIGGACVFLASDLSLYCTGITLDVNGGAIRDKRKKVNALSVIVHQSVHGWQVGPDSSNLVADEANPWDVSASALFDGASDIAVTADWDDDIKLYVRHDQPLPFNMLAIIPVVEIGG